MFFRLFLEQNKEDNRPRKIRGRDKKKKPRSPCFGKGRERQAACTNTPWPRERGEGGVPSCNKAERYKQERAPRASAQGAVSHGRPVLTGRNGESAAARRSGAHKNEEAPRHVGRGPRESSGDLLSRTRGPGTIGDLRLNFRVRDGNGCDPHSITAETISLTWKLNQASVLKRSGSGLLTQ